MKFAEADIDGGFLIQAYGPGRVVINERAYTEGLIVSPEQIINGWGPETMSGLSAEHFEALVALSPQVIILGTGARQTFPDPSLYVGIMERRIGLEVMDTGAACRTYNILMAEGRAVVAGLILD